MGRENFGCNRHISLHILIFLPIIYSMKGFPTFFPTLTKKSLCMGTGGNSWVTFHKFSSTPGLARGSWEWLQDSPACQGTQGQLSEGHLCSPIPSLESPRIHPHCRTAASSKLRLTSLTQSTWNKIKWTNTGFNWDSQFQFKTECQQAEPNR